MPTGDIPAQAACALAAGLNDRLQQLLRHAPASRETLVIGAALAARLGDWRTARRKLNATFAIDGMTAPLNESVEGEIGLGSFGEGDSIDPRERTGGADRPRISIVVPARNAQGTLGLAVRSLLKQTWQNLEILIVDDRSTDRTLDIAWDLARADPRTKVVSNRRTPGPFGARNSGVDAVSGEFIAFHDADDWAHPQRLEWQMRALGRREGLSVTRYFRLDDSGQPVSPRVFPLVRLSPIAMVVRAEAWRAAGSFEEVPLGADSEWLARFDERFGRRRAARMRAVCMVARWAAGSLSASPTTGMEGEGRMRRIRYETDWRWRHAGVAGAPGAKGQPRPSAFASFAGAV
ncbi:MAG: glycosyltransferase family A protein [Caulobacteraceae bacterium]